MSRASLSTPHTTRTTHIGVVGARGHTGGELLRLIDAHDSCALAFASSQSKAGALIADQAPAPGGMRFLESTPESLPEADAYVLALPNGASPDYVRTIERNHPEAVIVDLSADHRFDPRWTYGLPEHFNPGLTGATRIANPGCYATAMQLALRPLLAEILDAPHCFGVSGYSGAGSTPSPRNDPARLEGGVLPYALAGHIHEREVTRHLECPVRFAPHVAPFFRGLSITTTLTLAAPTTAKILFERFSTFYAGHPLVHVVMDMPRVQDVAGTPGAIVGGFTTDGEPSDQIALVCVLDNLLKGAAVQAMQNLNLAFGRKAEHGLTEDAS